MDEADTDRLGVPVRVHFFFSLFVYLRIDG